MTRMMISRVAGALLVAVAACGQAPAQIETRVDMTASAFARSPDQQWRLPAHLRELSGLAATPDGRLFGHDDERAVIYEIDIDTGTLVKSFSVGTPTEIGDFEGLAVSAEGDFWITTAQGVVYRFREGGEGAHVAFERFETGLAEVCDVEGLAVLATEQALILACKDNYQRPLRRQVTLYRWPFSGAAELWRRWPEPDFADAAGVRRFRPSAIETDAARGRLIMLSAFDGALAELTLSGDIIAVRALGPAHPQAEAVAILPNGALIVGDEGRRAGGSLMRYPPAP